MADARSLAFFLGAVTVLMLTPGPDMLYIVARSLHQGRRAGIFAALGTSVGYVGHILAAAVGLSGLLMSSALAFSVVKTIGAAYLVFLGIRMILGRRDESPQRPLEPVRTGAIFRQGILTNALNPKVALFFLALLPQFVEVGKGSVAAQFAVLGLIIMGAGLLVGLALAVGAGYMHDSFRRNERLSRMQRWLTGGLFIGLGVRLALSKRGS